MYNDIDSGVAAYVDYLVADYKEFNERSFSSNPERVKERVATFADSVEIRKGKKYIKVIVDRAVRAFVVTKDEGKFKAGDLLKPASYAAPAKNSARGNVLEGKFSGGWTGPEYLR